MIEEIDIRPLDPNDYVYARACWRESHKQAPGVDRVPWAYYKHEYGQLFEDISTREITKMIAAYRGSELLGWLCMTPGKRVHTLHWVHVRHTDSAGNELRRRGLMGELFEAAQLGSRFIYTLRGRRLSRSKDGFKSLDEPLVKWLASRDIVATYVPLLQWVK